MSSSDLPRGPVSTRQANASDLDIAKAWLSTAGLPVADLTAGHMEAFIVAMQGGNAVGMIGLENFGGAGLLRSLVVEHSCRDAGIGRQLVDALETTAVGQGISELWLLTIDADPFFARLGYVVADRGDAPAVIRDTAEFSSLCPGDAVLMRKRL